MTNLSDEHTAISHTSSMDSSLSDMRRILDGVQHFPPSPSSRSSAEGGGSSSSSSSHYQPPAAPEDEEDFSVMRYGSNCVVKSRQVGRDLTPVHPLAAAPHMHTCHVN